MLVQEVKDHLVNKIIPFWNNLRDDEYGGYYGYLSYDLHLDKKAVKGCILNSRILWFYSNAYKELQDETLLMNARHAYQYLRESCIDKEHGGVYWSLQYDGVPDDTTKHTYNQAFAVYALSSYYDVSRDEDALKLAWDLYDVIEGRCMDLGLCTFGYMESFEIGRAHV